MLVTRILSIVIVLDQTLSFTDLLTTVNTEHLLSEGQKGRQAGSKCQVWPDRGGPWVSRQGAWT